MRERLRAVIRMIPDCGRSRRGTSRQIIYRPVQILEAGCHHGPPREIPKAHGFDRRRQGRLRIACILVATLHKNLKMRRLVFPVHHERAIIKQILRKMDVPRPEKESWIASVGYPHCLWTVCGDDDMLRP